jgi:hypothetical protein
MVLAGDVMYKRSLEAAIEGQNKVRSVVHTLLPTGGWGFDD